MPHGSRLGTPRSRRVPLVSVPSPLPGSSIWDSAASSVRVRTPHAASLESWSFTARAHAPRVWARTD
eukprot:180279-Prymnesium_polylepis.1